MCSPGEVVLGSQDAGSGGLHRLPGGGGGMWIVTCACTQDSWGCSSSVSISCPSLWSSLIAEARAHLGGALPLWADREGIPCPLAP